MHADEIMPVDCDVLVLFLLKLTRGILSGIVLFFFGESRDPALSGQPIAFVSETISVPDEGFLKVLELGYELCLMWVPKLTAVVQAWNNNGLPQLEHEMF